MSEFVEILKIVLEKPEPLVIGMFMSIFLIYRSKNIIEVFFDIKDMKKKRIIQKFEDNKSLYEMNYLNSSLKNHYERLCEEAQIHAIIGCQYCSKEMAEYILSRKNISRAIRIYHRIMDEVQVKEGRIVPVIAMNNWRIKLNSYGGIFFYVITIFIGASPFLLVLTGKFLKAQLVLPPNYYLEAFIYFVLSLLIGFFFLYESLKPEFTDIFCTLEMKENDLTINPSNEKAA
jgi:hypothetical protein